MAAPIIEAHDLGISFTKTRRRKLSLRELFLHGTTGTPRGVFWPLRHVSFKIQRGEAVGIIGRNGTGKSTLLKLIAGVLLPDEGKVKVRGEVAPLLELRAGFNEELSGRENIYLLASLHGMKQSEIDARFDEIVDFAEVHDFIDMRLRHYSSGMKVRLGFAVIAQLDHPILLVDEVLAVGDRVFKQKCYKVIQQLLDQGRTLLLVSHSEKDLRRFCKRGIFINAGELMVDGPLDEALDAYHGSSGALAKTKKPKAGKKSGAKHEDVADDDGEADPADGVAKQHDESPADVAAGNK